MYDFALAAFPWVAFSTALAIVITYMDKFKKAKEKK